MTRSAIASATLIACSWAWGSDPIYSVLNSDHTRYRVWHKLGYSTFCTAKIGDEVIGIKKLNDGERWTIYYEGDVRPVTTCEGRDGSISDGWSDSALAEAESEKQAGTSKRVSFSERDEEARTITIWHNLETRAICKLIINGETVGAKELRDGEKWTYEYEIEDKFSYSHPCQTSGAIVGTKDERNRLVLRNVSSKTYSCRVEADYIPTKDLVIAPEMAKIINVPQGSAYRWNCTAGVEYKGHIEKQ